MQDLLPQAVKCGMKPKEFFHSTPNEIYMQMEAYRENLNQQYEFAEYQAWLNGLYDVWAIGTCFDKKTKYPENPLEKKSKEISEVAKKSGKSEAQIQQELLYMQLRVMQVNHELRKSDICAE